MSSCQTGPFWLGQNPQDLGQRTGGQRKQETSEWVGATNGEAHCGPFAILHHFTYSFYFHFSDKETEAQRD